MLNQEQKARLSKQNNYKKEGSNNYFENTTLANQKNNGGGGGSPSFADQVMQQKTQQYIQLQMANKNKDRSRIIGLANNQKLLQSTGNNYYNAGDEYTDKALPNQYRMMKINESVLTTRPIRKNHQGADSNS